MRDLPKVRYGTILYDLPLTFNVRCPKCGFFCRIKTDGQVYWFWCANPAPSPINTGLYLCSWESEKTYSLLECEAMEATDGSRPFVQ